MSDTYKCMNCGQLFERDDSTKNANYSFCSLKCTDESLFFIGQMPTWLRDLANEPSIALYVVSLPWKDGNSRWKVALRSGLTFTSPDVDLVLYELTTDNPIAGISKNGHHSMLIVDSYRYIVRRCDCALCTSNIRHGGMIERMQLEAIQRMERKYEDG